MQSVCMWFTFPPIILQCTLFVWFVGFVNFTADLENSQKCTDVIMFVNLTHE